MGCAMKYHSVRNAGCLAVWVAEADDEDGGVYTAIFIGKNARQRAEEYAAWKNGSLDPEGHGRMPEQPKAA
jgi:hypothetical protein